MAGGEADSKDRDYWRVAIVEDHLLQRKRTEELVSSQDGVRVVWSGEKLTDFVAWARNQSIRTRPHLLILDLMVDRVGEVDPHLVRKLVDGGLRVLVVSAMASVPLVRSIIRAGVHGVVSKRDSEDEVIAALWAALERRQWITPEVASMIAGDANRPRLSDQEERALVLYASGLTLDEVAKSLGVQPNTAKKYLERAKRKY
ncbi:MAG TPA: response regulator, partial [Marmoricola sp.]|nr:response regulator [Marmoricola sp.]